MMPSSAMTTIAQTAPITPQGTIHAAWASKVWKIDSNEPLEITWPNIRKPNASDM
jgi:hypothetical protein